MKQYKKMLLIGILFCSTLPMIHGMKDDDSPSWRSVGAFTGILGAGAIGAYLYKRLSQSLELAIIKNDSLAVRWHILTGTDLNAISGVHTPLTLAITCQETMKPINRLKIIKLLIQADANLNKTDSEYEYTPLMMAVILQDLELVNILLDAGANVDSATFSNESALTIAVAKDSLAIVQALIKAGANLEICSSIEGAPLQIAINSDKLEIIRELLAAGANVNHKSGPYSCLTSAVAKENLELVDLLIAAGAVVNEKTHFNPLKTAITLNNIEIVDKLLSAKVNIHQCYDRFLNESIRLQHIEISRKLLAHGAQVGYPELDEALNQPNMLRFLLHKGELYPRYWNHPEKHSYSNPVFLEKMLLQHNCGYLSQGIWRAIFVYLLKGSTHPIDQINLLAWNFKHFTPQQLAYLIDTEIVNEVGSLPGNVFNQALQRLKTETRTVDGTKTIFPQQIAQTKLVHALALKGNCAQEDIDNNNIVAITTAIDTTLSELLAKRLAHFLHLLFMTQKKLTPQAQEQLCNDHSKPIIKHICSQFMLPELDTMHQDAIIQQTKTLLFSWLEHMEYNKTHKEEISVIEDIATILPAVLNT